MLYFFHIGFIFILISSGSRCQSPEQIIVPIEGSFSFDCNEDESVYFSRRLDDWSEIQEDNNLYSQLNLKFNVLNKENILRVTVDSVEPKHAGYYGCRKATWTTTSMSRIYHLILADVESFYWSYICHGPAGSCTRTDGPTDETSSTFEVADKTKVDLFCCASVTGYKDININMNQIGQIRGKINIKRTQELDRSWVVCANQHTLLDRKSSQNEQTLTCELIINKQPHSSFSSFVVIKDAMPADPDFDLYHTDTRPSEDGSKDDDYFNRQNPSSGGIRKKLTTGKQIVIIIGSIIGGLFLFGFLFGLIFFLCRKKKALTNNKTNKPNEYSVVSTHEKSIKNTEQNPKEEESVYIEPTPLYENSSMFLRL